MIGEIVAKQMEDAKAKEEELKLLRRLRKESLKHSKHKRELNEAISDLLSNIAFNIGIEPIISKEEMVKSFERFMKLIFEEEEGEL